VEAQPNRRQHLPQVVVETSRDPTPFLVLGPRPLCRNLAQRPAALGKVTFDIHIPRHGKLPGRP
jgi:hypothetical protein